jgi:hypothetical protein
LCYDEVINQPKRISRRRSPVSTTTIRTDIHRPSVLDPSEYEELGIFYQGPNDYMNLNYSGEHAALAAACAAAGNRYFSGNFERTKARQIEGGRNPLYATGTCDHCGAAFFYGACFLHVPTGEIVTVGWQCANDHLGVSDRASRARKTAEKQAASQRVVDQAVEKCPEDVRMALQANRDSERPNQFLGDLYAKLYGRGWELSERQIEAVRRSVQRDAEFAARRAAEREALVDAPPLAEGRQRIVGEIVSAKEQDTMYGLQRKMLVRLADGNKVWGTVPSSIIDAAWSMDRPGDTTRDRLVGLQVQFTAQVERSHDDTHFGFFKRPTNAEVV